MEEEFFTCTLSRKQRISTVVFTVGMTLTCMATLAAIAVDLHFSNFFEGIVVVLPIVALCFAPLIALLVVLPRFAPMGYAMDAEGLAIVRRNGRRILLPRTEIVSVEAKDPAVFKRCIRGGGVGGYFGSWGYFWSPALKGFRAYITNIDTAVAVRTRSKGLFVLSPDDRERFVAHAMDVFHLG